MSEPARIVGIRHLKARLSSCLRRVRRGERLTVTDRGRPIATLAPVDEPRSLEWVHRMAAAGDGRWGGGKPRGLARRVTARGRTASRLVIEDRR